MSPQPPRSRRAAGSGQGPRGAAVAIVLLVVIVAGAAVLLSGKRKAPKAAEEPQAERPDPFADLPPDVPKHPTRKGSVGLAGSPFADVALPTDDATWSAAKALADRGKDLVAEAVRARDAGDRKTAQEKGAEAQKLLTQALDMANPWLQALRKEREEDDPVVKAVDRETQSWVQEVVALKKTAGL